MSDPVKRFELSVLRPLWGMVSFLTVLAACTFRWRWVATGVITDFCIGLVGALLHPTLSASDLAQGPVMGAPAVREASILPDAVKYALVSRACLQVALLLGVLVIPTGMAALGWHWYAALLAAIAVFAIAQLVLSWAFRNGQPSLCKIG